MVKSRKRLRPPSHSLRKVIWVRSSTTEREGFPQRDAVRIIMKLMGFLTRKTNSSHASSSLGPAQRKTMSFRDKDKYRVGLELFDIVLFPVRTIRVVSGGPMDTEVNRATRQAEVGPCCESHFEDASPLH